MPNNYENKKKETGAIVWINNKLGRITSKLSGGKNHFMIQYNGGNTTQHFREVRLAKVNDEVEFIDLNDLPKRCETMKNMRIFEFHPNGSISTTQDLDDNDTTSFMHFKRKGT